MRILIEQAVHNLRMAEEEINRPSESVMTFTACQCTREAVIDLLNAYLANKKKTIQSESSMENILKHCAAIDSHFNSLDISCFMCGKNEKSECTSKYCLGVTKANECYTAAEVVKEFVFAKLHLNE